MKYSWKRLIAIVCVLMMTIGQIPANVWAEAPQANMQTQAGASPEGDKHAESAELDKADQPATPDVGASSDQEKKSTEATDADSDVAKDADSARQDDTAASDANQAAASGEETDADSSASSDPALNPPADAGTDTGNASDSTKNPQADAGADSGDGCNPAQDPSAGTDKNQDPAASAASTNENTTPVGQMPAAAPAVADPASPTNLAPAAPAKSEKPAESKPEEKPKADHEMKIGESVQFSLQPGMTYTIRVNGRNGKIQVDAESAFALKVEIKDETNNKTKNATGKDKTPFQTFFGGRKGHTYLISIKAVNSNVNGSVKLSVIKYEKPVQQEQSETVEVKNDNADKRAEEQPKEPEADEQLNKPESGEQLNKPAEEKTDAPVEKALSDNQEETNGTESQNVADPEKEVNDNEIDGNVESTSDTETNNQPDETGENKLTDDKDEPKEDAGVTDNLEKKTDVADNEKDNEPNKDTAIETTDKQQEETGKEPLNDSDADEKGTKTTNNDSIGQDNGLTDDAIEKDIEKVKSEDETVKQSAESGKETAESSDDENTEDPAGEKDESADMKKTEDSEKETDKEIAEENKPGTDEKNNDEPISSKDAVKADIKGTISSIKEITVDVKKASISDLANAKEQLIENLLEDPKEDEAVADGSGMPEAIVTDESTSIPVAYESNGTGSLVISKTVRDSNGVIDAANKYVQYPIVIEVEINKETKYVQDNEGNLDSSAPNPSLTIASSSTLTIQGLPFGEYTIKEINPEEVTVTGYKGYLENQSISSVKVNVNDPNKPANGDLVNVYEKDTGKLAITKKATGDLPKDQNAYQVFVKYGNQYVSATVDDSGTKATFKGLTNEEKTYSINKDQTITFDQMPVGDYIVSEKAVEKLGYVINTTYKVNNDASASSAQVKIKKDETASVEIDNHYRSAELVIKKTIIGVEEADIESAAAKIKITVADSNDNKLLENVVLTSLLFEQTESTYITTLRSTDEKYAKYLVPDGEYTVTETIEEPDGYGLTSSKYAVTAKTDVPETDAESGMGYTLQLTDADVSKGEIDYTNEYQKAELPVIEELEPGNDVRVEPDDVIVYKISYKNYKSRIAEVSITDQLDKNVEYVDSEGNYDNKKHQVTWKFATGANTEGTVELTVKVKKNVKTGITIKNKANVTVDADTALITEEVINPVPSSPVKMEFAPDKGTGVRSEVRVGDEIQYLISFKNYKSEAAEIVIVDKLDDNVEYVSASQGHERTKNSITWTFPEAVPGQTMYVNFTVKVKEDALEKGKVINGGETTTVRVGQDKAFTLNTVENPVSEQVLPMKKEITPYDGTGKLGAVKVGEEIKYEISYRNYKAKNVNIIITDKLDPNVEFVPAASDGGVYKGGVVTWTIPDVPAGTDGKVTLTVKLLKSALTAGKVVNNGETATVKVCYTQRKSDGTEEEKVDEYKLNTIENLVPEAPVNKEKSPHTGTGTLNSVKVDQVITYEISYKNYKTEKADVIITDTLDQYVSFVEASKPFERNEGTVTWTIKDVAPGNGGTVTLKVKVLKGALTTNKGPGRVTNSASVQVGDDIVLDAGSVTNPVTSSSPNTGDGFNTEMWLVLLILSLLGAGWFGVKTLRGKKSDQKKVSG